jgi:hypothetical protein
MRQNATAREISMCSPVFSVGAASGQDRTAGNLRFACINLSVIRPYSHNGRQGMAKADLYSVTIKNAGASLAAADFSAMRISMRAPVKNL